MKALRLYVILNQEADKTLSHSTFRYSMVGTIIQKLDLREGLDI